MKKMLVLLLALVMCFSFAACKTKGDTSASPEAEETSKVKETEKVTKNDYIEIEGVYVDQSYNDGENSSLKMAYVFLNVKAPDKNCKADCKYAKMTINDTNTYDSDFYKGTCEYAPSYYYSSFVEDVYVGDSLKIVLTFKIPEGDLASGKSIVFSDTDMQFDGIKMSTDDIVFCNSAEEVCEKGDPTGYAEEIEKHSPADATTENNVKELINGYYWTFYVSAGTTIQAHEIEFYAPDKFEVRTNFGSNGGTYEVKKGFIYVTYSTNNATIKIPYELKDGDISLYCESAFSIYE